MASTTFQAYFGTHDLGRVEKDSMNFAFTEEGVTKKAPRVTGSRHRAMGGETLTISFTTLGKEATMAAFIDMVQSLATDMGSEKDTLKFTIEGVDKQWTNTIWRNANVLQRGTDGEYRATWTFETTPLAQGAM